jgi:hypothetical protein
MKREAATKNKGKGGDDDARDDQASLSSSKMIMSRMESGSNLHGHLQILHEGPWLHDHEEVRKKVKLYDFKRSTLREATRFLLFMFIYIMNVYIVILKRNIK